MKKKCNLKTIYVASSQCECIHENVSNSWSTCQGIVSNIDHTNKCSSHFCMLFSSGGELDYKFVNFSRVIKQSVLCKDYNVFSPVDLLPVDRFCVLCCPMVFPGVRGWFAWYGITRTRK
jgi:hypothetical protein